MADIFSSTDPYLEQYKTQAEQATKLTSEATTLPDLLKQALDEKLANAPIVGERATAASDFLSSLSSAPASVLPEATGGVVLNPAEQEKIIGGRRALALQPLLAANQRYDLLSGQISDIIGAASRAATAQAQQATGGAEIARNLYTDMVDRIYKAKQLETKGTATGLSQLLAVYRLMKPTAQQQTNATNAQSGLAAVKQIKDIMQADPSAIWYAGHGATRIFSPNAQKLYAAMNEAKDVLTRLRTGAALNKDEISFYDEYLPKALEPGSVANKLDRLETIYKSVADRTQVPDLATFLSEGMGSLGGLGQSSTSDWEVVSP